MYHIQLIKTSVQYPCRLHLLKKYLNKLISHDIYHKMIEDIEDYAILLLDRNGIVQTWNNGAQKIKGYQAAEIIGKSFEIFYTPEDLVAGIPAQLLHEAEYNHKAVYEGWRVRNDGKHFWGSIVATALYDDYGELIGFTKITRDLTDKKLAEEQLEQFNLDLERLVDEKSKELYKNEMRFRTLVENNYEAISLRDANKKLIYQSPGTEKLFGFTFQEMKDMPHDVFFHPDDAAMIIDRMDFALQNPGIPAYSIQRVRHKDGHYLWMEGTITNMFHEENIGALVGNYRDITERKKTEEKLLQANRLYAFVSAINQTIVHAQDEEALYNRACQIAVDVGKFELAWIGIPDIQQKTINVVAHHNAIPEDLSVLQNMPYRDAGPTATVLLTGKPYINNDISKEDIDDNVKKYSFKRGLQSFIVLPIKRAGVTFATLTLHSRQQNIFDQQELILLDEVIGDISFAIDVFEKEKHRKAMEEQIAHSEKRLRQAQAIAHFGSWELDFKDGFGIWTEETCRIYGLDPSDNVHTYAQWLSFIHPADIDHVLEMTTDNGNPTFAFFHRIVRSDGSIRHLYSQAEKEYTNGIPTGLYGVVHDITDMKMAEDAFRQSTANLNVILNLIPQAVFVKDYNGKFIYANKNFADVYGLPCDELLDKQIDKIIPADNDPVHFLREDREIIDNGISKTMNDVMFTDHTGKQRLFTTIKVPYIVPGTNEKAVLGISQDITDIKRAEQEKTRMVSDIIMRNKDLEQFSYIVSHNLRAPVANIIGLTDLLLATDTDQDDQSKMLTELSASAEKLDAVVRDMNTILQVRSLVSEKKEVIRLNELVADVETSIKALLKNEDARIICDFSAADHIFSVKSYLYSICSNLITNSIKYRRTGVQPIINITSSNTAAGLELTFSDNGLGIDMAKAGPYIFGLYKRFHHHVEGKGIGLYMVKAQVETLSGRISVQSEVNKGTTFRVVLPGQQPD
jgi:PAS domain S-box-containing protein